VSRPACIIPALDAAATLPSVIAGVRAAVPDALIIGINDGSRDATGQVLASLSDGAISFARNRGKGAALRAGFRAARARGCEEVVTLDADGQHDPACVPRLLECLATADLVIGARARRGTSMPLQRRLSNYLATSVIALVARCPLEDAQSGFRAMRLTVLDKVSPVGDRYEYETELLIGAALAGFRIASVRVPTIYGEGRSHFGGVRDTARIARAIWRHRAAAFG
jgi:glycosyltransferase involved in cell wall biosynthesis